MKNTVDGLKNSVELGEWRGHGISYNPKEGTYESDSAGIENAKTLAEVKRAIDAQEKRAYKPVKAVIIGRDSFNASRGALVTLVRPAQTSDRWYEKGKHYVWVVNVKGERRKELLENYAPDTPRTHEVIAQYKTLTEQARLLDAQAEQLLKDLPRAELPEALEPGEE